jgi:hypothetical protein
MTEPSAREFSIEVSNIVREYIEQRFQIRAAHRTTQEFLHDQMESADARLRRHRELLGYFLDLCDLGKFAGRDLSTAEMDTLFDDARVFIAETAADDSDDSTERGPPTPESSMQRKDYDSIPST